MRKVLLFFFVVSCYLSAAAQDQPSSLQVRMWDNSLFAAIFGGDETAKYQRTYNARSIAGGEYYLRIMQRTSDGIETIFEGQIEIPPGSRVQAILQEDGGLEISVLEDVQRTNSSFDLKSKIAGIQTKIKGQESTGNEQRNELVTSLEFADIRNNMSRAETDQKRDSIGVEGLKNYLFTTAYVVQMARLFRNETSRLEFVKSAYTRVVDPEQYFQVRDLFYKEENKLSLDKYMEEKKDQIQVREFQGLF